MIITGEQPTNITKALTKDQWDTIIGILETELESCGDYEEIQDIVDEAQEISVILDIIRG